MLFLSLGHRHIDLLVHMCVWERKDAVFNSTKKPCQIWSDVELWIKPIIPQHLLIYKIRIFWQMHLVYSVSKSKRNKILKISVDRNSKKWMNIAKTMEGYNIIFNQYSDYWFCSTCDNFVRFYLLFFFMRVCGGGLSLITVYV